MGDRREQTRCRVTSMSKLHEKKSKKERMELERSLLQEMAPPSVDYQEDRPKIMAPEKAALPPSLDKFGNFHEIGGKEMNIPEGWEDLLGKGQLLMRTVVHPIENAPMPDHGEPVTLKIMGRLQGTTGGAEPGETFMSDREVTYRVGFEVGHVVQAIGLAVRIMRAGQIVELAVNTPHLGYGAEAKQMDCLVPANSPLQFRIELCAVQSVDNKSPEETFAWAHTIAAQGKESFAQSDWDDAQGCYEHALEIVHRLRLRTERPECPSTEEALPAAEDTEMEAWIDAEVKWGNNLVVILMTSGKKQAASEVNDGVLMVQPSNLKALCQRVRMLMEIGDLEKAREVVKEAVRLHPKDTGLRKQVKSLKKAENDEKQAEKNAFNRMLGAPKAQAEVKIIEPPAKPPPPPPKSRFDSETVKIWIVPVVIAVGACAMMIWNATV